MEAVGYEGRPKGSEGSSLESLEAKVIPKKGEVIPKETWLSGSSRLSSDPRERG
eukprot:CAMPEP_0184643496 /NCGR_PEP_ID=MMETSP0308-20130426/354_1 /TAXON_ID=38269 /ORGANISM="Gloeochaete witrockiana, Strain SAG 46.84" /LENGTH=53 /DNA_ID=CAMNT_0027071479 /DNA_START=85 /DNA_END=246 /DNA_ORIENTATION=-